MSQTRKGKFCGPENHFFGKHHTEDAKKKMSEAHKKIVLTDEWKANIGKAAWKKVINIDTGEIFNSIKSAAEKYSIAPTHITRVCKGKRKTAGGYKWSYYEN